MIFFFFTFCSLVLTHGKHSSFLSRSKRSESDARGQINYPRQPFPLSSPSDTPEKSGPYQRLKGPSASQANYFPPFYFTLPSTAHFLFPSYYPFSVFNFIFSIYLSSRLSSFNPMSQHYLVSSCHSTPFPLLTIKVLSFPLDFFFNPHFLTHDIFPLITQIHTAGEENKIGKPIGQMHPAPKMNKRVI